jgi:Na+/H+-dicarboxylate symporter/ABC-type amino acid transport substrate-binding protein
VTSNRHVEAERRTLSAKIAVGLVLGIAFGLFVGEWATMLDVIADGYIKLLQMTVLPYVTVSIIGGLGALNGPQGVALVKRVGLVLVLLWVAALAMVFLFPLMFPPRETASFFSSSLIQDRESFDFLSLYIPANPFNSLANNIVPAVVLFSVIIGTALINIPDKARLLDVLAVVSSAVMKATHFIIALTPYGVFAIAAVVAGTLSLAEFERLQVYLISYVGMALLIAFWVLPGLVAALTPVPYGALIARTRNALAMAFMTTSLLAVLPILTEEAKALVKEYGGLDDHQASATDVVVPVSFNFPHTGKVLSLSFLLFAGWFADARVPFWNYPKLAGAGLLTLFGNVNAAIPFMLDLLRIPADTFRLFVTSGIINARFGTLVAAVHTLTIAVLGTCAVTRTLTFDARKMLRFAIVTFAATAALVGGTRVLLRTALNRPYDKDAILSGMGMLRDRGPARVFADPAEAPPLPAVTGSLLDRVRSRGALRVGYFEDSLPYVFVNTHGALVGFDVEMALQLARDLRVDAEFVRVDRAVLDNGVDPALCDIVMSGVAITADRAGRTQFTTSYLDETLALIVPDYRAADFSEWSQIRAMGPLRFGVPAVTTLVERVREQLPEAALVPINGMDDIFSSRNPPLDAAIATAERGSAYTILHPAYAVVVPKPRPFKVPLAYAIAGRDASLTTMLNTWIELQRKNGTADELFGHWILGENAAPQRHRWSVLRDVLHWVR